MTKPNGQEFFYLDRSGKRSDRDMHAVILGQVKTGPPIDEKIMGPIRARNRAKWLTKRERQKRWRAIKAEALRLLARTAWVVG